MSGIGMLRAAFLALIAHGSLAIADDQYGSAGVEITDGSELKHYNALLDQLGQLKDFQSLGTIQPGSPYDNYLELYKLSRVYVDIVRENGGTKIPDYNSNSLAIKDINAFRSYAIDSMMKSNFNPSEVSCGASVVFIYPTLVASTLQNIKPEYIEPKSTSVRITALRQAAQQDLKNDWNILTGMCNTVQLQPVIQGFDNFLSLLRSDSGVFLASVAAEIKRNGPQQIATPKPKQPYDDRIPLPVTQERPYVAAKADQYSNCAAIVNAARQFSQENGFRYDKQGSEELELQFITTSVVYSSVAKFEQYYPTRVASNLIQMQNHPEQIKYWLPQTSRQCVTDYNRDLSYTKNYQQAARNEYLDNLQAIIQAALNKNR